MIRFDKLTLKGQEALQSAQAHAQESGNPQVMPEHLLWALIQQKDGVVLPILEARREPADDREGSRFGSGSSASIARRGGVVPERITFQDHRGRFQRGGSVQG